MNSHSNSVQLHVGRLTRISLLDVPVPVDLLGLTTEQLAEVNWAQDLWADGGQLKLGAAAWVLETPDHRIVFDPMMALDVLLRADPDTEQASQQRVTEAFSEAGLPVDSIDEVLVTHVEDIGMLARQDASGHWSGFFPNASIRLSRAELVAFQSTPVDSGNEAGLRVRHAWDALIEQGIVETFEHGQEFSPGLFGDTSAGHSTGHTVFHLGSMTEPEMTLIGHLAVSPVHLATGECADLNEDPSAAWMLLHGYADDGRLIAGSLWPAPGAGRWLNDELVPFT